MRNDMRQMTPKQRLLCAMRGQPADRLPWSPFLAYFWEHQSTDIQEKGPLRFLEDIGADPLMRGSHRLWKQEMKRYNHREETRGVHKTVVHETPVGTLREGYVYSAAGNTWFLVEHPVKTREDFKVLTYINEHMRILPDMEAYVADQEATGERALYLPLVGSECKSSFQSMIERWVGTEELVYALADDPEPVEECLAAMGRNSVRTAELSADSPAEAFIFWEDSSTTNISPAFFDKYIAPEINAWGRVIRSAGKLLVHHACGHIRDLLPLMARTEIDMIESISPPPTGNVELWEARSLLPETIGLTGGIEPTVFLNSTEEELTLYVCSLLRNMRGERFILANSDSCPPGVTLEKFRLVTEIVHSFL